MISVIRGVTERLDPARHDRSRFSSGIVQVDNFLQQTANKLQSADNARVFVVCSEAGELIGFYALNAHAVNFRELPARFARSRPRHGEIPAAYIAMIGVAEQYQGQGFGGRLLVDAFHRIALAADSVGIALILLDVLDCGDPVQVARRKTLYEGYGFQALPSQPLRLFLPMTTVRSLITPE